MPILCKVCNGIGRIRIGVCRFAVCGACGGTGGGETSLIFFEVPEGMMLFGTPIVRSDVCPR